jgi:hypothetical protein
MRKQKNKRGALTRGAYTQTIVEKPVLKTGKPNSRFPGTKTITHGNTGKP